MAESLNPDFRKSTFNNSGELSVRHVGIDAVKRETVKG